MKKLEVKITIGLPGSGKSTFKKQFLAENPDFVAVSRDDFRSMFRNQGGVLGNGLETVVTQAMNHSIIVALNSGKSVMVDNTHLKEAYLNQYSYLKDLFNVSFTYEVFDIGLEECILRDSLRENPVGEAVITKMNEDFEQLKRTPKFKHIMSLKNAPAVGENMVMIGKDLVEVIPVKFDPSKTPALIYDLDGTMAHMGKGLPGRRGPFEEHRVGEDDLAHHVRKTVLLYKNAGYTVIAMSGRTEGCRQQTEEWLKRHDVPFHALHMRSSGDSRHDGIVKLELFNAHVRPFYNVELSLDDRQRVVDVWRSLGLTCYQVAVSPD